MKRTIRLPVVPERPNDMLTLMELYSSIYEDHVDWSLANRTYSKQKAHVALYDALRAKYQDVPSALIQAARDNALEAVKTTKFKRKPKPKRYATIRYDRRTCTLRGHQLTLSSVGKRQRFILTIPDYFVPVFDAWKFTGCTLSYNGKQFWVNLNYEKPNPQLSCNTGAIGVDRGIYNIATTSDGQHFSGRQVRACRRRYLYNRRTLQAKGTRSAKRRLRAMSGKEQRFSKQVNHVVSKQIVALDAGTFVLERLSAIRMKRGKKLNKWLSNWSFWQLEQFLIYKAEADGKQVVYVDARYTSQRCNLCGYVDKKSRSGSRFVCTACGYAVHADVNAALNIRDNYISAQVGRAGRSQSPVCSLTPVKS